jgi:hypothetical protein
MPPSIFTDMPWDAPFFERELMASSSISMELFFSVSSGVRIVTSSMDHFIITYPVLILYALKS